MSALEQLAELFAQAKHPVVLTGAGVSTESGIPDFRSPGGIWDRYRPIDYRDFLRDPEARRETWRRGLHTYPVVAAAEPNPAHLALAALEQMSRLVCLITQNIDGLHQRAGHTPERVIELHGNAHSVRCLRCDARYPRAEIHRRVEAGEEEPACPRCGGILKPCSVSFGEALPTAALEQAQRAARACDLFVVVGSSLVVYPAAGLPELALACGAELAIVNATPTRLDGRARVVLRERAGVVLPALVEALQRRLPRIVS